MEIGTRASIKIKITVISTFREFSKRGSVLDSTIVLAVDGFDGRDRVL
jgi:hypothetical protein